MSASVMTAILLAAGWLVGCAFLIASYMRAGPIWIERHSLKFHLAGKEWRCSGAVGEIAVLAICALLLWVVDLTTPALNFVDIILRYPWLSFGALIFVSGIVAAHTAKAVEHPDPKARKILRQTYSIYAVYSALLFAGGMILVYCIVTQFWDDTATFGAAADKIVESLSGAASQDAAAAHKTIEFTFLDAMLLLSRAQDQMTPIFIFAIAIFSINLAILYTPLRGLYLTNAVFLTNVGTLVAIAAVGAAGAYIYIVSYNAFVENYVSALAALPRDLTSTDGAFQRRYTDILLAMEGKGSLVGFVSDMSNEWAGLTAVVGVVQAAASRLTRKPEIAGSLPSIAINAALDDSPEPAPAKADTIETSGHHA